MHPANASLIVVARPLDAKSGLSELDVVGIVINGRELTPPANSITIRGADGAPLIADKYFDRGSEISDAFTVVKTNLFICCELTKLY